MYEAGYSAGLVVGTILKFAIPVALIALIVFLVIKKNRKGK